LSQGRDCAEGTTGPLGANRIHDELVAPRLGTYDTAVELVVSRETRAGPSMNAPVTGASLFNECTEQTTRAIGERQGPVSRETYARETYPRGAHARETPARDTTPRSMTSHAASGHAQSVSYSSISIGFTLIEIDAPRTASDLAHQIAAHSGSGLPGGRSRPGPRASPEL
jgi:hypothetical protein